MEKLLDLFRFFSSRPLADVAWKNSCLKRSRVRTMTFGSKELLIWLVQICRRRAGEKSVKHLRGSPKRLCCDWREGIWEQAFVMTCPLRRQTSLPLCQWLKTASKLAMSTKYCLSKPHSVTSDRRSTTLQETVVSFSFCRFASGDELIWTPIYHQLDGKQTSRLVFYSTAQTRTTAFAKRSFDSHIISKTMHWTSRNMALRDSTSECSYWEE